MLKPWQLIKLKQQYGGVYVITFNKKLYVSRQPTLLEIMAQYDAKKVFNLSTEEMFYELVRATLVYPEDPDEVPEQQIRMLAEQTLDDIPLTNAELENKLLDLLDSDRTFLMDIAVELWSQVAGTTIHEFYNRPISEVLEMYSTIKVMQELAQKGVSQQQEEQQMPYIPNIEFNNTGSLSAPPQQTAPNPEEVKKYLGKSLDEVLSMMAKEKGGK